MAKQDAGASHERKLLLPRTALVEVTPGAEKEAAARLERDPNVLYAEPNAIVHEDATPNDTRFTDLWGLNNTGQQVRGVAGLADADVDAPEAWNLGAGLGSSVRVAVVDSGVVANHTDLAANGFINPGESGGGRETNNIDDDGNGKVDDFRGWDFAYNDNNPTTNREHGTHVAGTIAAGANNSLGVAGAASFPTPSGSWLGPRILAVKVLNEQGSGTVASLADGLVYAGTHERQGRQRQHQLRRHLGDPRQRHQEQAEHAVRGRGRQRRRQQRHLAAHAMQPRHRTRRGEQDLRRGRELQRRARRLLELRRRQRRSRGPRRQRPEHRPDEDRLQRRPRDADRGPLEDRRSPGRRELGVGGAARSSRPAPSTASPIRRRATT